jgi:hypothetical protein
MARGKFNKRGGGPRLDPVNAEEIELRNTRLAELDEERTARRADSDDDEEEDEKDGLVLTDADREKKKKEKKAADKKKKEDKKKAAAFAAANPDAAAVEGENGAEATPEEIPLSRKDMPEIITTEADHKRNMGKLAQVRKRREEAEARRKMEEEAEVEKEEMQRAKIASVTLEDIDAGGDEKDDKKKKKKKSKEEKIPKLGKIDIKKMKPAQMKEALKERGLEIQGNATALQARLTAFEAAR